MTSRPRINNYPQQRMGMVRIITYFDWLRRILKHCLPFCIYVYINICVYTYTFVCCVVLYVVALSCGVLCCVVCCCVVLWCVLWRCVLLRCLVLCFVTCVCYCVVLWCVLWRCVLLRCLVLCFVTLCVIALSCGVFCDVVCYCVVLCCVLLCVVVYCGVVCFLYCFTEEETTWGMFTRDGLLDDVRIHQIDHKTFWKIWRNIEFSWNNLFLGTDQLKVLICVSYMMNWNNMT